MSGSPQSLLAAVSEENRAQAKALSERLSQELVFALVGPVASGVTSACQYLRDSLSQQFGYDVAPPIQMSEFIRKELVRIKEVEPPRRPLGEYITKMQNAGNLLRKKFGNQYLAEKAVEQIFRERTNRGGYDGKAAKVGRRAYIIDSLKNMDELNLLREIYRETLCVVGIFAPDAVRQQRLADNDVEEEDARAVVARDDKEVMTFGQQTRDVFVEADFFICNAHKLEELRQSVERYVDLIFNVGIHTPTTNEMAMYAADASAANSACMSRQVGAAIVSATGELISVGRNDVPKFRGGLYTEDDRSVWNPKTEALDDCDHRCFKWRQKVCHNEMRRNAILDKIVVRMIQSGLLKSKTTKQQVAKALTGTEIDSLIEYSRAIHAEMEAILAVARESRHSLVGGTLYTTTYPCHNCARHIVAAGITKVIYIQPYRKSLATALHGDAITEDVKDFTRVIFQQYDGVAPRKYLQLFRTATSRKIDGKYKEKDKAAAVPVFQVPLDAPVTWEAQVIAELAEKEQNLA